MKCPHCTVAVHSAWSSTALGLGGKHSGWVGHVMACPNCKKHIVLLENLATNERRVVYPQGSNRGPVPPDVPKEIAADYNEAALVIAHSAKASAALSRRCLQTIFREAGYLQKDLAKQIDAVLAETDTTKALPCVYRKPNLVHNGDEVRPGSSANLLNLSLS